MKNLTFFTALLTALLFVGCAGSTTAVKSDMKKTRFQSVPIEKMTLLQEGENKESCAICGMHLPTFYKTSHVSDTKHDVRQYCSLHCVVDDNELNKTDLENLRVVDTNSLKYIPATDAFYVVGSSKPGTMSRVSKYAFSTKQEADNFAKDFGGEVMKFYDAYNEAAKDFTKK